MCVHVRACEHAGRDGMRVSSSQELHICVCARVYVHKCVFVCAGVKFHRSFVCVCVCVCVRKLLNVNLCLSGLRECAHARVRCSQAS